VTPTEPAGFMPDGVVARCSQLVKIYPAATGETQALRGVEVSFHAATMTAITGPSGSGKSTLLAILALRERQGGGGLHVDGLDVGVASRRVLQSLRRQRIGWVAQRPTHSLFPQLTARQQIEHVGRLRGRAFDVTVALRRVGLGDRADAVVGEMSGGEQQRLAVAAAVVGAPSLVLADEPTAELDDESAELVLAELRRCTDEASAVVLATHDARAVSFADRVLQLRHGVLSTERAAGRAALAAIDSTGRVQLPPEALSLFPDGRAVVRLDGAGVRLDPPGTVGGEGDA
jgi:putative ABC transport system ATP-binding protein